MTNHVEYIKRAAHLTGLALLAYITLINPAHAAGEYILIAGWALVMLFAIGFILIPSFIAFRREHPYRWLILLINLVLGGTIFVWFIVLFWALQEIEHSEPERDNPKDDLAPFAIDPNSARVEPPLNTERPYTAQTSPEPDAPETLQRIKLLFEAGAISAEEYTALRKPILNRYLFEME